VDKKIRPNQKSELIPRDPKLLLLIRTNLCISLTSQNLHGNYDRYLLATTYPLFHTPYSERLCFFKTKTITIIGKL